MNVKRARLQSMNGISGSTTIRLQTFRLQTFRLLYIVYQLVGQLYIQLLFQQIIIYFHQFQLLLAL